MKPAAKKKQALKPPVITDGRVRDSYEGFHSAVEALDTIGDMLAQDSSREGLYCMLAPHIRSLKEFEAVITPFCFVEPVSNGGAR